jgi:prepilin-type N-terminal cleavage/methylation domain-containing protein
MKANRKGFTLIELMIVLFLITIILGLSGIFFSGFLSGAKFDATAREISAVIRHARYLARTNMQSQTVIIDLDNKTYGIEGFPSKYIAPGILIKMIDPFLGEVAHGKYSIVFHPAGGMNGGTMILSRGKRTLQIEMDPITGALLMKGKS